MATKTYTTRALANQTVFRIPQFTGNPTVTVNGSPATVATVTTNNVVLATPVAQDDTVAITFNATDAANMRIEYFTPTTGQTVVTTQYCARATLSPAGTLATLTVTFPPTPSKEGQQFRVSTTQTITALSFTGGTALKAPTTLAAGTVISFQWNVSRNTWVFMQ